MTLTTEQQEIVTEELKILSAVLESLRGQASYSASKFTSEQDKSREMNASIVASYRAEEKAMLASDEAVAHALSQKKKSDLKDIQKMLKRPYFARIIVEEERPQGKKTIEYKLGLSANPDCRIIDWRSAPISKLYYEYREGDEYEEEILGQIRIGKIMLRRTVEIEHGVLRSITCPQGSFEKKNSEWTARQGGARSTRAGAESTLADVLPLVTPEQFQMITEDAETAILIQGVAGSGKTTVALHRLSWLMQAKEDFSPSEALILLFSKPLQKYIQSLLPALELNEVPVLGFTEWAARTFKQILPIFVEDNEIPQVRRSGELIPSRLQRLKSSMALLDTVEAYAADERSRVFSRLEPIFLSESLPTGLQRAFTELRQSTRPLHDALGQLSESVSKASTVIAAGNPRGADIATASRAIDEAVSSLPSLPDFYLSCYAHADAIVARDETKLIDVSLVKEAFNRTSQNIAHQALDAADESLLLRLYQVRNGILPRAFEREKRRLAHIIADEVQDYAPAELATIVAAVEHPGQLTLVGDVAQSIHGGGSFPGWDKLKQRWKLKDSIARAVSLTISYRSTLPIMRLADRVHHRSVVSSGRDGRVPILFRSRTEDRCIEAALKWLEKAVELYPNEMSAVLCADRQEARHVYSLLKPRFSNALRIGDEKDFSFEEGIVVSSVSQVKGLEFANVLIWNPRRDTYPNTDLGKNLLYVAITRAIENLSIVSWGKGIDLLPNERERLMRIVDLTVEEEEEEVEPRSHSYAD